MDYDLVFEGGGAKGMVFVGAMQEFEARGHKYGRLLGTSAGAITATLLAVGYSSAEMLAALNEKLPEGKSVFTSFMAEPAPFDKETIQNSSIRAFLRAVNIPLIPDILEDKLDDAIADSLAEDKRFRHFFSFVERGGWFSADNFLTWIHDKLNSGEFKGKKRNFGDMRLDQFYQATKVELSLVASDITAARMLVLNHFTAPSLPVIWAVRMSMSIPLLWQEVIWREDWGLYQGRVLTGDAIVDGGLLSNFPIELFLSDLKDVTSVMGEKVSQEVLGFLIDEEMPVPNAEQTVPVPPKGINISDLQTVRRLSKLVDTTLSARDKMVIDSYSSLVARMPAKGYGTTEFDMTEDRRQKLLDAGRNAMRSYFKAQEHPADVQALSFGIGEEESAPNPIDRIATRILR
jgi:NTE family protein